MTVLTKWEELYPLSHAKKVLDLAMTLERNFEPGGSKHSYQQWKEAFWKLERESRTTDRAIEKEVQLLKSWAARWWGVAL